MVSTLRSPPLCPIEFPQDQHGATYSHPQRRWQTVHTVVDNRFITSFWVLLVPWIVIKRVHLLSGSQWTQSDSSQQVVWLHFLQILW
jgi:hypothetical protein